MVWRSEVSLQELILSSHQEGSRGWRQVIRLGGRTSCLLSHLASSRNIVDSKHKPRSMREF